MEKIAKNRYSKCTLFAVYIFLLNQISVNTSWICMQWIFAELYHR